MWGHRKGLKSSSNYHRFLVVRDLLRSAPFGVPHAPEILRRALSSGASRCSPARRNNNRPSRPTRVFLAGIRAQPRNPQFPALIVALADLYYCAITVAVRRATPRRGCGCPLAMGRHRCPRETDTPMIHLIIQWCGCPAVALAASRALSVWWRGHVHMRNVDRVCALMEQQAASGCPTQNAADVLLAVNPAISIRAGSIDDLRQPKVATRDKQWAEPGIGGLNDPEPQRLSRNLPCSGLVQALSQGR